MGALLKGMAAQIAHGKCNDFQKANIYSCCCFDLQLRDEVLKVGEWNEVHWAEPTDGHRI